MINSFISSELQIGYSVWGLHWITGGKKKKKSFAADIMFLKSNIIEHLFNAKIFISNKSFWSLKALIQHTLRLNRYNMSHKKRTCSSKTK